MSDKKYVMIIIGTVLSIVTVLYLLILFLPEERYMDKEYPLWMQQKDYISTKGTEQEVILLGDSRMNLSILTTKLGENTYNLSLGGATPIEMYYTLKTYLEHHPVPKAVIIAFGPQQFTIVGSYISRGMYFHYFDDATIEYINRILYEMDGKDFSFERNIYKFRSPNVYMAPIFKSLLKPRTLTNRETYKNARTGRGWIYRDNDYDEEKSVYLPETKTKRFVPLKSQTYFMEQILQLCQKNNIPVYIDHMPMGNPGYQMITENGYLSSYKAYLKTFSDKYGVPINYDIPVYEARFFRDYSHLNLKGAEIFTQEFKKRYLEVFGE